MSSETIRAAHQALEEARVDPSKVLAAAPRIVEEAKDRGLVEAETAALHALGVAYRAAGDLGASIDHLVRAARLADKAGLEERASTARIVAASSLFLAGRKSDALRSLTAAARNASEATRALVDFQRATIHSRAGDRSTADELFARALVSFEALGDDRRQAMVLHNQGMLSAYSGNVELASDRLLRARDLFDRLGQAFSVAGVDHSLGIVALYRGDLVEALRLLDDSEGRLRQLGADVAEVQAARCEALLSGGLFADAEQLARAAAKRLEASDELVDQAELLLVAATASILRERYGRAEEASAQALELLEEQGRPGWLANARHVRLRALAGLDEPPSRIRAQAHALIPVLEDAGQWIPAVHTRLLAGRANLDLGDLDGAARDFGALASAAGPIELRISSWLGRALLREARGDRRGTLRAARAGLGVLQGYSAAVGATDVRSGLARHGEDLVNAGLRAALSGGRPRSVFGWIEALQTQALLRRPLQPSSTGPLAADLVELRRTSASIREAGPSELQRLLRRQTVLQNRIRRKSHRAEGAGGPGRPQAAASEILERLAPGTAFVAYAVSDGDLWAVVLSDNRSRLRNLGSASAVFRLSAGLRAALDRAARGPLDRVSTPSSARELAKQLDELMIFGLGMRADRVAFSVPTKLGDTPWGMLPSLAALPFSVTPSATSWVDSLAGRPPGDVVLAAGPQLSHASGEVRRIAELYPSAVGFSASRSKVHQVLAAAESAAIAHIACHGRFNVEQPLFSALALADGDLTLIDLHSLTTPPAIVVLSACEAGLSGQDPGAELLGFSGSLLAMGSRAVVAAAVAVPDSPAMPRLMARLHARLIAGDTVAEALAHIRMSADGDEEQLASSSFVCFGNGEAVVRL